MVLTGRDHYPLLCHSSKSLYESIARSSCLHTLPQPKTTGLLGPYHGRREDGYYNYILPGDTKLSSKWHHGMAENPSAWEQWSKPVSQVLTYASESFCRYGFIITDKGLTVLHFTPEVLTEGSSLSRPRRQQQPPAHQRIASGSTDLFSNMGAMSLDLYGAASYVDEAPGNEFLPPKFARIPWDEHSSGKLTVKLALFCLFFLWLGTTSRGLNREKVTKKQNRRQNTMEH